MQYIITQARCEDRIYEGFSPMMDGAATIAICAFDGDSDLYTVDSDNISLAKTELVRMYTDDYDRGPSDITIYSKLLG